MCSQEISQIFVHTVTNIFMNKTLCFHFLDCLKPGFFTRITQSSSTIPRFAARLSGCVFTSRKSAASTTSTCCRSAPRTCRSFWARFLFNCVRGHLLSRFCFRLCSVLNLEQYSTLPGHVSSSGTVYVNIIRSCWLFDMLSHHHCDNFGETMQLKGFEKVRDLRCERESKTSELNKTECLVRLAISLKRRKKKSFFFCRRTRKLRTLRRYDLFFRTEKQIQISFILVKRLSFSRVMLLVHMELR